ncbi:MAG: flagella synthesis protein FlgN [Steroidobacteraceae bacterium]
MDASLYRDHLACLLDEEATALANLEAILGKEYQHITTEQLEELEQVAAARDTCMTSLLRIDAERQSLCRAGGFSADKIGLLQLIQWCDPSGTIHKRWQQSTSAIRNCRALNDRNGALINNRLKRVEGLLNTLNGATHNNSKIYSARGNTYQNPQAGRVCHIQA